MNSILAKFAFGEWNLGICNQDFISLFSKVKEGGVIVLDVHWMKHNHFNSFYADPFIYDVAENRVKILAEEYFYDRRKGVISLLEIDCKSGRLIDKSVVLEETCHLSYPFYDKAYGTFIPESFRNGNWVEYDFDGAKVSNKRIITDFPMIDATPVLHNGKWYVFATTQPNALDELLIYWSDKHEGPYKPHPLNPQKKDIKTSRCGGKFFEFKGELYRPVQDSTHLYGETIHIMKVTELTPTTFKEEFYCDVKISNPGKYALGFHTLNFQDGFVVVDGYRDAIRPLFAIFIRKVLPLLIRLRLIK